MAKWFRRLGYASLLLLVAYALAVQVLRWLAYGDEEREALAVMDQPLPVPSGPGGFKYLAFNNLDIPLAQLDAALAEDVAAYGAWHAGQAERLGRRSDDAQGADAFVSPLAGRYPPRAPMQVPEAACHLRDADCLATLHGNEAAVREWIEREADRLALASMAIGADHLANPYATGMDSPIAAYQLFRLPLNDIALQALSGDYGGALDRACGLLAASRRFLRQDGGLIDKMVSAAFTQSAGGLVLAVRRADPAGLLPESCEVALEAVSADDYLVCSALRAEFGMMATLSRQTDALYAGSWNPVHLGVRWLLQDGQLLRGWSARPMAPLCREENFAGIKEARLPAPDPLAFSRASVDYLAAPISYILAHIGPQSYENYQNQLLDQAAVLRLQLAAIAQVNGALDASQVPEAASSPGYAVVAQGDSWELSLREERGNQGSEFRIPISGG
jgi:hypothetical protein